MTTANKVTVLRILLVPFFIFLLVSYGDSGIETQRWAAVGCFALAALLDGVDGFIARRFHQKSELGAVLDPLADKLLLVSALILLGMERQRLTPLPVWLNVTVISRDVLILIGMAVIYFTVGHVKVKPRWTGKFATVFQMAVVVWCMLKFPPAFQAWLAAAAATLTGISGLQYVWDGTRQLSSSPRSAAIPDQE
jgi:cardiolipin synthase